MNSVHPLHRSVTRKASPSYNFLHFTLQEYLAAVYIWKNNSPHEQLILFETKSNEGVYKMILQFLAGLTKLADPWTRCVLPVPKLGKGEYTGEKVCDFSRDHILWLYESQNVELITSFGTMRYTPDLRESSLSYLLALGYCVAAGKFQLNLSYYLLNVNMLNAGMKKLSPFFPTSVIKRLTITGGSQLDLNHIFKIDIPVNLERITILNPTICQLPGQFLDILRLSHDLKEVDISHSEEICTNFLDSLVSIMSKPSLKRLTITLSPPDDLAGLSDLVMKSSLEVLVLKIPVYQKSSDRIRYFVAFGLDVNTLKQQQKLCKTLLLPADFVDSPLDLSAYYSGPFERLCYLQDHSVKRVITILEQCAQFLVHFAIERKLTNSTKLDCEKLGSLFETTFACPSLKCLYLRGMYLTGDFPALTDVSYAQTFIQTIDIDNCSQSFVRNVFMRLKKSTSVQKLGVTDFRLEKVVQATCTILRENSSLQEVELLVLKEHWKTNSDFVLLLKELQDNTHLKKIVVTSMQESTVPKHFGCHLDLNGIMAIRDVLQINKTLLYLELSIPLIEHGCISMKPIVQSLCVNSVLKTLILKLSKQFKLPLRITIEDITAVGDMLAINKTLQVFHLLADISDCSPIFGGLSANKTIEELGFSETTKESIVRCPEYLANRYRIQFVCAGEWLCVYQLETPPTGKHSPYCSVPQL